MNFDPRLVQRLNRPLKRPGVTNHRMAEGLLERFQVLGNRLPLLDQQLSRWATIVEFDGGEVPIVYAQASDFDDQEIDNFQESLVVVKKEVRSPAQNSPTQNSPTQNSAKSPEMPVVQQEIPASPITSVEETSVTAVKAIASPEQELSFIQLPQNSDSTSINQELAIHSEPFLTKISILPIDLPTVSPQNEQILTQISDRHQISSIPTIVEIVSNTQPEISQPLVIQSVSEAVIQARHDNAAPSIIINTQPLISKVNGAPTYPLALDAIATPITTEIDFVSDTMPLVQQEISPSPIVSVEASVTAVKAIASTIPLTTNEVSKPVIKAKEDLSIKTRAKINAVLELEPINFNPAIASSEQTLSFVQLPENSDSTPMAQGLPIPSDLSLAKTSILPIDLSTEAPQNEQILTQISDRPQISSIPTTVQVVSDTQPEVPQSLIIQPISEGVIQARYDNAAPSIINSEPVISTVNDVPTYPLALDAIATPISTEVDSTLGSMPMVQQQISSIQIASVEASVTPVKEIASETTPITINAVSDPVIQTKEDLSVKTKSLIDPVLEPISFTPAIASLEQELSFVQLPQNSASTPINQGLPIPSDLSLPKTSILPIDLRTEFTQTKQTLTQISDRPQIPIIPISNSPSALPSEPLSFATNILSEPSEPSDHQLSPLQVQQVNAVNTKLPEDFQATVQVVPDAQPEISQPLIIQPVSEGVIQARYDSAAPSIINVQPSISTVNSTVSDAPTYFLPFETAIAPIENVLNRDSTTPDPSITKLPLLDSLPEVVEIPWTSSEDPQNLMPIVNAAPITLSSPSIVANIPSIENSAFESPTLIKVSKIDVPTAQILPSSLVTQTLYSPQDRLVFTPSNPTPVNENKVVATPIINPKTKKFTDSALSNDPQNQVNFSPVRTQIVREKVSISNSLPPLSMENFQNSQPILTSVNNNSGKSPPLQSAVLPTVQAIAEISEQNFEPLLLSCRNSNASASEITGNYPNQTPPNNARAIANPSNMITYPTSNSSTQTNISSQLSPSQSFTVTNRSNQDPNNSMRPQNIPEVKEANTINMDLLVAQVERKIMKRLVVEGERRGKRKWL